MPHFSPRSLERLHTCDVRLQTLFKKVIEDFDCTILCGYRGEQEQNRAFESGKSKLRFPQSKHNQNPSHAVDVAPYPVDGEDRERMTFFAGFVFATALSLRIPLRWGGDWDSDTEVKDNSFDDLVHFEIKE